MMGDSEDGLLRDAALKNAASILLARRRAEDDLSRAQEALQKTNARLTQILESITDAFIVVDGQWTITYMNRRARKRNEPRGSASGGLVGRSFWEVFPFLLGTPAEQAYRRALDHRVTEEFELFYAPLGKWFSIRVYPTGSGLTIYSQDITEPHEARALLAAERKILESIATGAPLKQVLDALAREAESLSTTGMACAIVLAEPAGGSIVSGPQESAAAPPTRQRFSSPIKSSRGDELGAIALEYPGSKKSGPDARDRHLIDFAGRLAAIAIERTRSEQALHESESRFRAMFEQAATGIAIATLDGTFVELNDKFCSTVRFERDELRGKTFLDITHEDDKAATRREAERLLAGEVDSYVMEKRYVGKDGALVWSLSTVTLLRDDQNRPQRFIGVIEDITERKLAEEKLRHSEEELRVLANSIPQLAWMADAQGHVFWYNQGWYDYTGTTPESMQGEGWRSVYDPQILPTVLERWKRSLKAVEPFEMEYPLRGADGQFRWFLTRINPVRDAQGRATRWFGTNTNVDEVRRMREALQEEARILELLNSTGATLVSNLDLQTLLQAITDAATKLSGAQFGAFFYNMNGADRDTYMLYTLSGAPREAFDRFGQPRATAIFAPTFNGEGVIRLDDVRKDPRYGKMAPHHGLPQGHLPVCSYLAVPVASRSGSVLGGLLFGHGQPAMFSERHERIIVGIAAQAAIAIDNARLFERAKLAAEERTRLLESERAARADAERASALKDEFLATLSHELRTPLSAILGWSQVLRRGTRDEATLLRGLDTIERNARAQTQLIEDLLDMSRITSGKLRLDIQPVDPVTFIEAAVETMRPAADAKGVRLEKILDPQTGPVAGDPGRLQQVIWNLLSNAIKFTPKGGRVQVSLERVNSNVEINISDTGIGIRPGFLPHAFERFRQGNPSITRTAGGLGLGLSIVKHLVELHGGSVQARSPGENMGSTFSITLPLMALQRTTTSAQREHPTTSKLSFSDFSFADLSGVKVLVVDDEPDARELIQHVLTECHATVVVACDAAEALQKVPVELPDVVISDIGMPETDGYTLLARIRKLGSAAGGSVPAIALTAFARSEDRTRALRAGFLVHVAKPVEPEELVATVASVVGRMGPKAAH